MSKVDQWLKEQEKNYPTIEELKEYKMMQRRIIAVKNWKTKL